MIGNSFIEIQIEIQNQLIRFKIKVIIIENLSDPINLGINFLKAINVNLISRKNEKFSLVFDGITTIVLRNLQKTL